MKVLGFMSLHYGIEYLAASLSSIKDHVEKVHIAYTRKPSHGFQTSLVCPDKEWEMRKIAAEVLGDKLIWETYEQFGSEIEHREMRYKHSKGYSLILTIDADEVFDQTQLPAVLDLALKNPQRFYGIRGYFHFWKSFEYYFKDLDMPIRIENLERSNTNVGMLCVKVYHMSLCQRQEVIQYKMSCFGHKNEIKSWWWGDYKIWSPRLIDKITNLHPTREDIWIKPTCFDENDLPESLKNHHFKPRTKMKTLLIPLDYHRHTEDPSLFTDMVESFGRQADVKLYTGDMQDVMLFKPDVIHFQGSVEPEDLKKMKDATGALVTMWTGDARYAPQQSLILYKEVVDCFLLPFSGDALKRYETILGKPCHFIWEPIQNWRFKEPKLMDKGEVVFIGNHYEDLPGGKKRIDLTKHLSKFVPELRVRGIMPQEAWGAHYGGPVDYQYVPAIYNESYITICENNYDDLEEYFTPRNLGALATGTCALMRYFPGIEKHFENLNHCIYYRNKHELFEWIAFLKNSPHTRNAIASNGYRLAIDKFTYDKWVELYLEIIKNYLG